MLTHVSNVNEIDQLKGRAVVWYSASWCVPCQKMNKTELMDAAEGAGITLLYCDQTAVPEAFADADIRQLPTFIYYVDGTEVARRMSSETAKVCMWLRKMGHAVP